MPDIIDQLIQPVHLATRHEVLGRPSIVPSLPGLYAWFFSKSPSRDIKLDDCWKWMGRYLLYVGISPSRPPQNGRRPSSQNLNKRIRYHMRGNAYGSTLRLSLGSLLAESLGIELRRVGSGTRLTFSSGEERLSEWMQENAFVAWLTHQEPWVAEDEAIRRLYLPLNLAQNNAHPFHSTLTNARRIARERARKLPVLSS